MGNGQSSWKSAGFLEGTWFRPLSQGKPPIPSFHSTLWNYGVFVCCGAQFMQDKVLDPAVEDLQPNPDVPLQVLQAARIRALYLAYLQRTWHPCQVNLAEKVLKLVTGVLLLLPSAYRLC